ncbi:hypothetical protein [Bradyrhizobium japonicum]|uniref:ATP dependent DNA ligase n=1 Tax=Bradyrhizobium japonicum TaxID=375 RepID=UPI0027145747|nr:hypothetical protein [Bradyrhizobium japonicum]WLB58787.1 hypothetical protein QIH94_23310 [Bradyrhizobium japonicum]WLB59412.1 hypothetical protein QIH96_23020 [Bradyrhizobium japonicum]
MLAHRPRVCQRRKAPAAFTAQFPLADDVVAGIWVEPKLLAEIEYRAKSAEGKVRHPFYKGLREDLCSLARPPNGTNRRLRSL